MQAEPEIKSFQIDEARHDFIALASDGIFDKLGDEEIGRVVWLSCEDAQ